MLGRIRVSRMVGLFDGATDNQIDLIIGEAVRLPFQIVDAVGAPVNLSGWTLTWTLKRTLADGSPLVQKKSTDVAQIVIDNAAKGLGTVILTTADTVGLVEGVHVHDLWADDGTNAQVAILPTPATVGKGATTGLP